MAASNPFLSDSHRGYEWPVCHRGYEWPVHQSLTQGPLPAAGTLKRTIRKLLQASNPTPSTPHTPFSPLKLTENGKTCILFWAKKLIVKLRNHTHVDLTDWAFSPSARVDLKGSSCSEEKAILSLRFGDVADLKGLVIRCFLLSNTYYESTAQSWFSLDSVHILYNRTKEASFNATQIYAPAVSSYHCQHVSSLHKYDMLLEPSSHGDGSLLWHITFIDFQIQAFNVEGGRFSPASDCASFFTPAILMGLLMSLILLLVLAYALHMVLHLKSIEQLDKHRPSVYLESKAESEPGDKGQAGQRRGRYQNASSISL
ncbi:V-type proton ATPase subunit S1-like protein [Acipenser oxyrinchus oxyrinchus]|uniref:V-type proton ATPase subunit S1-like protein n=1 Tax=Acipenser oxyrinchus oxyrinchus TaxID=40147 RepID=A0AAD8CZU5_ACIOX|nr:V-type proton ATPase subunit S1-like protein [Acipenser oxyrinchus oxyrinchus]